MNAIGQDTKLIMRLFHVRAKSGCAAALIEKFASTSADVVQHEPGNKGYFFGAGVQADEDIVVFASTSADVVQHEPGNKGYFFGAGVQADEDIVVFASFWEDLDAIKARFGADWQVSYLPDGYADMIEDYWVQHIDVGAGWHVRANA